MRVSYRLILVLTGVSLSLQGTGNAQRWQGRRPTTSRARQRAPATYGGQRRDPRSGQTGDDEKRVLQRVRGYQLQLEREEKLLSQRLAQAERLRQSGLAKKDQRLLDQAERYERKALAAYQQRVRQFEKFKFNADASRAARSSNGARRGATPRTPARSSSGRRQRSTRRTSPWQQWSWNGWR